MEVDVAIVGGGIVGFTIARSLAPHRSVAVLEAEAHPGHHSTSRSAAIFVEAYEGPIVRQLTAAARRIYEGELAGESETPLLRPRGQMVIARPEERRELEQRLEELSDLREFIRLIEPEEALALCPVLRPEGVGGAIVEPGSRDIDVDAVLQTYVRGARKAGADVLTNARVSRLAHDGSAWTIGLDDGRELRAAVVVNAAGAWAGQVARLAGAAEVPLQPYLRTALTIDAPPGVDSAAWPFVTTLHEVVYFKPDAGRIMVSLADERPVEPFDAWPEGEDVALAIERLQAIADIEVTRAPRSWAGLRTFAPDRAPVIGWDWRAPSFFWAAGVGGFGVQTSPAVGALAADLLTGRDATLTLSDEVRRGVSPGRFA